MRSIIAALLCVLFYSSSTVLADVELTGDGATADILGHSGKITMTYEDQSTQITMSSVTEVDSSGDVVGNTGAAAGKHSFNSFASQDFTFSNVEETTYQGYNVSVVNFSCPLISNSVFLTVQLYVFLEYGNTTIDGRNYTVSPGTFKFSYYLNNWPFCTIGGTGNNLCVKGGQEQEGAFLDFDIILKGVGNAKDVDTNSNDTTVTYDDNSEVVLPSDYQVDGYWSTMPAGYPLTTIQGSQQVVTFRFARFNGTLDYDPYVNWGSSINDADSNGSDGQFDNVAGGVVTVIVVCVVGGVIVLALLAYCAMKACGSKSTA